MPEAPARRHLSAVPTQEPEAPGAAHPLGAVAEAIAGPLTDVAEIAAAALSAHTAIVSLADAGGEHVHGAIADAPASLAGLLAQVADAREPSALAQVPVGAGTASFAAVPVILADGRAAACLAVLGEAGRAWTPGDMALLAKLAARAAGAIDLARLEAGEDDTDPLTGLVERARFLDRVDEALGEAEGGLALLYVDVDGHREIAESLGPVAADALLVQIADRLRRVLRPSDLASRMSGGAFTALCRDVPSAEVAERIAERVREAMAEPFAVDGRERHVKVTVDGRLAEQSDRRAAPTPEEIRAALETGSTSAAPFTDQIRDALLRSLQIEDELRDALDSGALRLHYQPVVSLADGRLAGAECLLRWEHPVAGVLEPSDFLPVAAESALMGPIARWTIEECLRQAAAWRADGVNVPYLSMNLSPLQLDEPGIAGHVIVSAQRHGVPLDMLFVEVTEDSLMGPGPALDAVWALRDAGAHVAVDDFGTGYSSLSHLQSLPIDVMKIDGRFVSDLGEAGGAAIVSAIVGLGEAMGVRVSAEGVETTAQAHALRDLGCEYAQGFLFAPALTASELARLSRVDAPFAAV